MAVHLIAVTENNFHGTWVALNTKCQIVHIFAHLPQPSIYSGKGLLVYSIMCRMVLSMHKSQQSSSPQTPTRALPLRPGPSLFGRPQLSSIAGVERMR